MDNGLALGADSPQEGGVNGQLTPRQHDQRIEAGRGRYAQMVREALERHPDDLAKAARRLTQQRKKWGFQERRSITVGYMARWRKVLGAPAPPTDKEVTP